MWEELRGSRVFSILPEASDIYMSRITRSHEVSPSSLVPLSIPHTHTNANTHARRRMRHKNNRYRLT